MKRSAWTAAMLAALLLTGCGASSSDAAQTAVPEPAAEITELGDTPAAPDAGFLVQEYGFALNLLRSTPETESGGNVMLSPYSVMQALGMTANGADGQTRKEMENLLIGGGRSVDDLNKALCGWRTGRPAEDGSCTLHTANGIWINGTEQSVKPSFLQLNQDYYAAEVHGMPFDDAALHSINGFVQKETDGMVPEILQRLDSSAQLVLVNAVAFDAKWAAPYEKSQIKDGSFTNADGSSKTVPMMTGSESDYLEQDGAVGFLRYYDGQYAFAGILPPENLSVQAWLDAQTPESLCSIIAGRTAQSVEATLPQFSADTSVQLETILPKMGMQTAFSDAADFSGISPNKLRIDEVVHKTHIDVTAEGTKAGAATAVVMTRGISAMNAPDVKKVRLDLPFVYMILDMTNELPVFIGTVQGL